LKGGHVYIGEVRAGEKVGAAALEFAQGDKYVGGFEGDTIAGHGVYDFAEQQGQYAGQVRVASPSAQGRGQRLAAATSDPITVSRRGAADGSASFRIQHEAASSERWRVATIRAVEP
jgi:hypothetical protein